MSLIQRHSAGEGSPANGTTHEVETTVKSNTPVNGEYRLLTLDAPQSVLDCKPGQFFHILCPVTMAEQPYLRRPMSIYGYSAEKGELQFLYKVTGEGTRALATLTKGDKLNVLGPLGVGFTIQDDWQNLLLLARGVGLATLAPLAQEAQRLNRKLVAICSARNEDVLMSIDHFKALGAEVITVTDAQGTSDLENLREIIENQIADHGVDVMYTCGSNRMLKLLQEIGAKHDIPGEIALEQQMACGLGMCQCCVRSFNRNGTITQERVCREGPVFGIEEAMAW
ncbi:dihydroorotate dehydrogenase electron transfer subunit [Neptunicoccus cionae]|uniref:Dihydroorotate dehydrogenase B (NAD(+)), electron transfer subunit n=1 Tax=Neptunicoccus cionae TaxID=2035344 RepID=A0A916R519_9RHOB|nr:dihydroorotate dehydrogenase electron transfer subunit [Amylibacter cionae]GGA28361.1 dihydroorotate dehydrogenase B (NAD(+)), electron transfer subunit [Amylibacter cionae]